MTLVFWGFEPEHIFGERWEVRGTFCFLFPNGDVKAAGGPPLFWDNKLTVRSLTFGRHIPDHVERFLLVFDQKETSGDLDLLVLSLILCWFSPLGRQTHSGGEKNNC